MIEKCDIIKSVGKEGQKLRVDGGVECQNVALVALPLLRVARPRVSRLLISDLDLNRKLLVILSALLLFLLCSLPSELPHAL